MAEYVGLKSFDEVDDTDEFWFNTHTWTIEKEEEFRNWLIEYLKDIKVRKELMAFPGFKTKKYLKKAAEEFLFMYGWRYDN